MTIEQRETVNGWFATVKDWIVVIGGGIAISAAIGGCVEWYTGGLKPQTQVVQDELRAQLSSIQTTQKEQASNWLLSQDRILARLDAMPRPDQYTDQKEHLGRLDTRLDELGRRIGDAEVIAGKLDGRLQSLVSGTSAPTRNPH
jgi:hypothetical protein